jgi:hypothetical protein
VSPADVCERTSCRSKDRHPGGEHLDPWSSNYDGPDTTLQAATYRVRPAAQQLLQLARRENWHPRLVQIVIHEMLAEINRMRDQATAAGVDRDRGIQEAAARALDCDTHGGDLRYLEHQSYWFWVESLSLDEQRVVWLSAVQEIAELCRDRDDPLARAVAAIAAGAGRGQDRVRRKFTPPTPADCQRAGRCEHPPTPPHQACQHIADNNPTDRKQVAA